MNGTAIRHAAFEDLDIEISSASAHRFWPTGSVAAFTPARRKLSAGQRSAYRVQPVISITIVELRIGHDKPFDDKSHLSATNNQTTSGLVLAGSLATSRPIGGITVDRTRHCTPTQDDLCWYSRFPD